MSKALHSGNPAGAALLLAAALLLSQATLGLAQCTSTSPYVGFEGQLTEFEHDVSGTVRIVDDCTFEVYGFTYDGQGPKVWWWGAPSTDNGDIRSEGRRIVPGQLTRGYDGETATFTLGDGITFDDFSVISLWCEEFFADFGHVELQQVRSETPVPDSPQPEPEAPEPEPPASSPPSPEPSPAGEPAPAPGPAAGADFDLANCVELLPGYFNLHWEVVDSQLVIGLEGRVGGDNRWLAFGFSAANATDVTMPGSDVVVGGMIGGECFAFDYMLQSRLQCSYTERGGVCPDFGLSGDPATNQVELLGCSKVGEVLAVTLTRPLAASDAWDRAWPLDGSGFPVWAVGPVSEGSNVTEPVVLYHRIQLPGLAAEESVHAPVGQGYRLDLGAASPPSSCRPLLAEAGAPAGAPTPGAAPAAAPRTPVATLSGVAEFNVTEGANPNYPNPPGWGVSYHINQQESPVLSVVRGTPYTFRVMAGPNHPFYLTDSIVGGGSFSGFANETIYGGGEEAHGTEEAPFLLEWMPDATTPDLLYYQCTIHMKLGWRVQVADA